MGAQASVHCQLCGRVRVRVSTDTGQADVKSRWLSPCINVLIDLLILLTVRQGVGLGAGFVLSVLPVSGGATGAVTFRSRWNCWIGSSLRRSRSVVFSLYITRVMQLTHENFSIADCRHMRLQMMHTRVLPAEADQQGVV